jgi:hypothetical protein
LHLNLGVAMQVKGLHRVTIQAVVLQLSYIVKTVMRLRSYLSRILTSK